MIMFNYTVEKVLPFIDHKQYTNHNFLPHNRMVSNKTYRWILNLFDLGPMLWIIKNPSQTHKPITTIGEFASILIREEIRPNMKIGDSRMSGTYTVSWHL